MAADKKNRDEQELERYGVWVKAGPDELDEHETTNLELMDIEDSDDEELLITEEEEKLLGELEESALPDFSDFEDSFGDSLDDSFDIGLDDDILDDDFAMPLSDGGVGDGESRELLHKIEDDLSALREEIRQLKEELTGLRVPAVAPAAPESAESGGFFDEEDDETIALTGDELDNILDSADMTEEVPEPEKESESDEVTADDLDISIDDEETIDLSGDFPEIGVDDAEEFDIDLPEDEDDPALSILGSPDAPEETGDPDTIEIDIPGVDETFSMDDAEEIEESSMVSIDDIDEDAGDIIENADDIDGFEVEDITDLDDFGIEDSESIEIPVMNEEPEQIIIESGENVVLTETFDDEEFDEGEEVEIDLNGIDDGFDITEDESDLGVELEDISLDDFGIGDGSGEGESDAEPSEEISLDAFDDDSDVLAVSDAEEIDLSSMIAEDAAAEETEGGDLDAVLAESIEQDGGEIDMEEIGEEVPSIETSDDLVIEEFDLEAADGEFTSFGDDEGSADFEVLEDIGADEPEELEIEEIDLGESGEMLLDESESQPALPESDDELDSVLEDVGEISLDEDLEDLELEEISLEDDLEEIVSEGADEIVLDDIDEIPEIEIDDAIDEIEAADAFALEDLDGAEEPVEDLEIELDEDDDIRVTLPDDDFNELPGTEEVDLDSLEALAAAPDLTEEPEETLIDLPELVEEELDDISLEEPADAAEVDIEDLSLDASLDDTPIIDLDEEAADFETPATIADKAKAALEIDSLPGDLKEEIKEVLKYMDQLLESLPDDKIQEFARSEHFEVYKKIFEELGISD